MPHPVLRRSPRPPARRFVSALVPVFCVLGFGFVVASASAQSTVRKTYAALSADVSLGGGGQFEDGDGILVGNNGTSNATDWRSFLRFDLPPLGQNPVISAKLRIKQHYQSTQNTGFISVRALRITSAWTTPTAYVSSLYNIGTADDGVAFNVGGVEGAPGATMGVVTEFDVTPIVRAWASGQPNHGISLRPANENLDYSFKVFTSSLNDPQPELVIEYEMGGGPTSAPVVNGKTVRVDAMRFTVISPDCIRIENSRRLAFVDQATSVVRNREFGPVEFTHSVDATHLTITTANLVLRYRLGSNSLQGENLTVAWTAGGRSGTWTGGQEDTQNLGGTRYDLDRVGRADQPNFGVPTDNGVGLLSRAGWKLMDDSDSMIWPDNGWMSHRGDDAAVDYYFCAYGNDYKRMLKLFVDMTGEVPMVPNYVFGIWYSRYQAYTQSQFQAIVDRYRTEGIPLDVMGIDVDWHRHGWEGYDWNTSLIPNPKGMIDYFKARGVKSYLNSHPGGFMQTGDTHWAPGKTAAGIVTTKPYRFDFANQQHVAATQSVNLKPEIQTTGVDFWWPDGIGRFNNLRTNPSLASGKAYFEVPLQVNANKRSLILNRYGGLGSQRYPIGFSGDTGSTWQGLAYQPAFTARASNVAFPYWSHDIGGFDPHSSVIANDLYLRWAQFGVFSPVVRNHANHAPRLPWDYPAVMPEVKEIYKFRIRLFPYIYHYSRVVTDTGVGLLRPLYFEHPGENAAYQYPHQYYFGADLLAAPITAAAATNGIATQNMWLPPGTWTDYWTGETKVGPGPTTYSAQLSQVPVYARPGAIIPHQPDMDYIGQRSVDPLTLEIFPHAAGELNFYEDDGTSLGYRQGQSARTLIQLSAPDNGGNYAINIGAAVGTFTGQVTNRIYQLKLRRAGKPAEIVVDGGALNEVAGQTAWDAASSGWFYDAAKLTTWVKLPRRGVTQPATIEVRSTAQSNQVAAPSLFPPPGSYNSAQQVALSTFTSGATIRYTTDGSTPTASSGAVYSSPIPVSATTTIKAIALKSGLADSAVASGTYTVVVAPQDPYGGSAAAIPGTIQAENYDVGGAGVAFQDSDANNNGGSFRASEAVDTQTTTDAGGGHSVGWTVDGEWLEYTVNVAQAGTYTLDLRVGSGSSSPGALQISFDGVDKTGVIPMTQTTWTTFTTISRQVTLDAGPQIMRVNIPTGGMNLNWFRFTLLSAGAQVATPTFSPAAGSYASAQTVTLASTTSGAEIRYTTDGSTPTASTGTVYSGPIAVTATQTIRAIATKSGMTPSAVASAAYTITGGGGGVPANVRIMAVGDSITVGTGTTDGGYRSRLQTLLTAAGYTFDFVGTQTINSGGMSDPQHEGYGGKKSNEIDALITPSLGTLNAQLYLIHVGTNDINMVETAQVEGRIRTMLDNIFAATPNARVILAKIIAKQDGSYPDRYTTVNNAVAAITNDYAAAGRAITWVNQSTLNGATDYADATFHPNASGYQKMAQTWFDAIVAAYSAPPPVAAPTFNPPGGTYVGAQSVTLASATAGATIRYTTDGSVPTAQTGTVYSAPIAVTAARTLRAIAIKSGLSDSAVTSAAYTIQPSSAYGGTPVAVPGTIQAENFDLGGQGFGYSDAESNNQGGAYRLTDGVDIQSNNDGGAGFNVGWTNAGEWMNYTIDVAQAGTYSLELRVGSGSAVPGSIQIEFNGRDRTGPIALPTTTWTTFTTLSRSVFLQAGVQVMKVRIVEGGSNLNWFRLTATSAASGFATWADQWELPSNQSGAMADADGDGRPNLLEYALASHPGSRDANLEPEVSLGGGELHLDYRRNMAATGLQLVVEWSDNLETWSTNGVTEQTLGEASGVRSVRASVPRGTAPQRFLRLRATATP